MAMMRRSLRRVLPRRDRWHALQEYAVGETNQEEFRLLRARDAAVASTIEGAKVGAKPIDWASWDSKIAHKEVLQCLKDFHTQQTALLETVLKEDHAASVKANTAGWELFDASVKSCEKSVEKSHEILTNGARALWISFQNPPISMLSQSEWLDADQYWQAFVEKHHFYHNHLCSAVEDPESKDYDAKQKADLISKWEKFDGRGTTRQNNKLLYQRPSFEYYDVYRGPLIEHMMYYLTKTGGDSRFFPQTMPVQWFAAIYDIRFKIYNVLQRRKRLEHEATWAREAHHDFHPHDLEHDGEAYFGKLIARETAVTEMSAARLMGNFILFSDAYVPVQTGTAFYRAIQMDGGKGSFYSLGSDVHCLFYKPAGDALAMPDPTECFHSLADHATMSGVRFEVGYAAAFEAFTEVLESRKEGLGGCWLTAPGESTSDAFMRRLKKSDPAYAIFEAYAAEHAERWASASVLSVAEAAKQMPEIQRKYELECSEYDNVVYGISEEFSAAAKLEQEKITKLSEGGDLQGLLDSGAYVAVSSEGLVTDSQAVAASIDAFDANRDKAVDSIMATKTALDRKK
eukprot:TRINITY_DN5557_c0_g1_i1.p1 TRINITY_DN5557_c0_g1~~TRINITY_DN5557_c0_g1_i1.p1  ORF type:complete len:572 (-),score=149.34 TRINITY_DN5557_c0_g1_i1:151-1866(-)